jgi:peptidoglycan hydrolase-like protein with peptidoglycan-binding domain
MIFGGFAIVLAGVTGNAMLQVPRAAQMPRSSPVILPGKPATAPAAKPEAIAAAPAQNRPEIVIAAISEPIRSARVIPDAAVAIPLPLAPVSDGDSDTIRSIQKELTTRKYGPLVVNGQSGPLTQAAIMGWEFDHSLALTGEASVRTLKRITEGAPKPTDPHARKIRSVEAESVVTKVQHALTALGYAPGKIDGRLGTDTERAMRLFESDSGMEPSGRVSAELFTNLARGMGAKSSATPR